MSIKAREAATTVVGFTRAYGYHERSEIDHTEGKYEAFVAVADCDLHTIITDPYMSPVGRRCYGLSSSPNISAESSAMWMITAARARRMVLHMYILKMGERHCESQIRGDRHRVVRTREGKACARR